MSTNRTPAARTPATLAWFLVHECRATGLSYRLASAAGFDAGRA